MTTQVDVRKIHSSTGGVTGAYFKSSREIMKIAEPDKFSVFLFQRLEIELSQVCAD